MYFLLFLKWIQLLNLVHKWLLAAVSVTLGNLNKVENLDCNKSFPFVPWHLWVCVSVYNQWIFKIFILIEWHNSFCSPTFVLFCNSFIYTFKNEISKNFFFFIRLEFSFYVSSAEKWAINSFLLKSYWKYMCVRSSTNNKTISFTSSDASNEIAKNYDIVCDKNFFISHPWCSVLASSEAILTPTNYRYAVSWHMCVSGHLQKLGDTSS